MKQSTRKIADPTPKILNRRAKELSRRRTDEFHLAVTKARSALSTLIRATINRGYVSGKVNPVVDRLIGQPFEVLFNRFEIECRLMGFNIWTDYGALVSVDHITPVHVFRSMAEEDGIQSTLLDCFHNSNLQMATCSFNFSAKKNRPIPAKKIKELAKDITKALVPFQEDHELSAKEVIRSLTIRLKKAQMALAVVELSFIQVAEANAIEASKADVMEELKNRHRN